MSGAGPVDRASSLMLPRPRKNAPDPLLEIFGTCVQQAAARENKDNKEVRERAERARAARAEREGAAATAQAYKSALGLAAKHDWGAKPKAPAAGECIVLAVIIFMRSAGHGKSVLGLAAKHFSWGSELRCPQVASP